MFVYKALHNQTPEYIKDMLIPYQSKCHLRLLKICSGDRAFSVVDPALWKCITVIQKICVKHGHF